MIDFRYHLVSIVAVFLALGLGIVLGATALQPGTLKFLYQASQHELHQIDALRAANDQLNRQLSSCCTSCWPGSGWCWSRPREPQRRLSPGSARR